MKTENINYTLYDGEKNFITYDYIAKETKKEKERMVIDCYEGLGWELISKEKRIGLSTILNFRRNRQLKKNEDLKSLQIELDKTLYDLESLEIKKTLSGLTFSLIMGIIGSLILGGGMSLCLLKSENIKLLILGSFIGIIGIIICGVTYPIYKSIVRKNTTKVLPIIEEKYDQIESILYRANDIIKKIQ